MLNQRITAAPVQSSVLLADYIFEHKVDVPGETADFFCARLKTTGRRVWLKFGGTEDHPVESLATEAKILRSLSHPRISTIISEHSTTDKPCLALAWAGEAPLSAKILEELPSADRCRYCLSLIHIVSHLESNRPSVALPDLDRHHLWFSHIIRSLRMVGLSNAVPDPTAEEHQLTRRRCWELVKAILVPCHGVEDKLRMLEELAASWVDEGKPAFAALSYALERELVACVSRES